MANLPDHQEDGHHIEATPGTLCKTFKIELKE
jgi:hypothetical protein